MSEKISIYYDKSAHGDLKGMLRTLKNSKGTVYQDRSESEIARMLLEKVLKERIADSERKGVGGR